MGVFHTSKALLCCMKIILKITTHFPERLSAINS